MKNYVFAALCLVACFFLQLFRGNPGILIESIAGAIILTSCVTTYFGEKNAVDNMYPRMGIAILAPLLIGLATA